jgi:hypothetical protein
MKFVPGPTQSLKLARSPFKPIFTYGRRGVPGALASRLADFAAALQARYNGKSENFRSQGLVYRRASLGLFVNRIYRQIRLTLTPRLQLSFQTTPQQIFRLSANQTLQRFLFPVAAAPLTLPSFPAPALKPAAISVWRRGAPPFLEAGIHPLEIQRVVRETSRLISQVPAQMIQRLAARLERVETVRQYTPASQQKDSQALSASTRFTQPLPMAMPIRQVTLNRTQAIRLEEIQPSDPKSQHGMRKKISAAPLQEFSSYPPTDMNRLADQVVQVINDRVTARQERFGRI